MVDVLFVDGTEYASILLNRFVPATQIGTNFKDKKEYVNGQELFSWTRANACH
jgi:hypothetical protein